MKFKSKREEFLHLLDNTLWDLGGELEMDMFDHTKELPSDQRDRHLCAMSAAINTEMALLRIISREYRRIYNLGEEKKCCNGCEKIVDLWKSGDFKGGMDLYGKKYSCLEDKERFPNK